MARIVEHYELADNGNGEYATTGPKGFWVAVLADSEEIVGYVGLDIKDPTTGEIRRMVTSPSHRRLGIASMLMSTCEEHARKYSHSNSKAKYALKRITLQTTEYQPHARALYARFGFSVVGEERWRYGFRWIRVFTYGKEL
ncbi:hypothetical protein VNI00_016923 [Paramarasmius palmivorus]|uniref:N-acetyltransferase domain-containing protein n=1 Tax=Paramarasmius palmivorus TaxID=297713 RepID=A0AAW0BAU1_9AGAR